MGLSAGNFRPAQLYVAGDYFVGDFSQANPLDLDVDALGNTLPASALNANDYVWVTDGSTGLAKRGLYVPSGFAATLDTDGTMAANSDTRVASQKATRTYVAATSILATALDTDGTLAANSDTKVASQKATKTYVDTLRRCTAYGPFVDAAGQNRIAKMPGAGSFGDIGVPMFKSGIIRAVVVACFQTCTAGTATFSAQYGASAIGTGATTSSVSAQINTTNSSVAISASLGTQAVTAGQVVTVLQAVAGYTATAGQYVAFVLVEH